MRWLILAVLGAGAFLYGVANGLPWLCLLSKPLPVIALLLWLRSAPADSYRRWLSIGLLLSLAGDMLLQWPADLFVFGLGAFLLAHLAYMVAYLSDNRRLAPLALLPAALAGATTFSLLVSAGLGPLLIPVTLYALTISAMLWRALARIGTPGISARSAWLAAVGAALFVLSDSLIGINRFVSPFAGAHYAIILTYWFGQWGIAASAFSRRATITS
ncbi:lysoplasmalogenase [Pseudomonas sp. UL073]|uniref:Lysoplasmalogenase n=1 Tax=Zestomonas insulae TaxID=2809017 RepID=A0ABS2IBC0_9GAMM|nr:lysoplasmalogenase [Pseudomonas insulae]MBM7060421.1 lysoplasmalogenase [Pseudomonas insulae]